MRRFREPCLGNEPCDNWIDECRVMENQDALCNQFEKDVEKPKLLLHSCCGPCSTSVVERLVSDWDVTIFFYNPNITDEAEYKRRRKAQLEFIRKFNMDSDYPYAVSFMEGQYNREKFMEEAAGLEEEPEGGLRCHSCYVLRLVKTAEVAMLHKFDSFTTTLTVSPMKNYEIISSIGMRAGSKYGVSFLNMDFKKNAGFQRSVELSKKYDLYRQKYCGCLFANK